MANRLVSLLEPHMVITDAAVIGVAEYLVGHHERTGKAVVPTLKDLFGLTAKQAVEAIKHAELREAASSATRTEEVQ